MICTIPGTWFIGTYLYIEIALYIRRSRRQQHVVEIESCPREELLKRILVGVLALNTSGKFCTQQPQRNTDRLLNEWELAWRSYFSRSDTRTAVVVPGFPRTRETSTKENRWKHGSKFTHTQWVARWVASISRRHRKIAKPSTIYELKTEVRVLSCVREHHALNGHHDTVAHQQRDWRRFPVCPCCVCSALLLYTAAVQQ